MRRLGPRQVPPEGSRPRGRSTRCALTGARTSDPTLKHRHVLGLVPGLAARRCGVASTPPPLPSPPHPPPPSPPPPNPPLPPIALGGTPRGRDGARRDSSDDPAAAKSPSKASAERMRCHAMPGSWWLQQGVCRVVVSDAANAGRGGRGPRRRGAPGHGAIPNWSRNSRGGDCGP